MPATRRVAAEPAGPGRAKRVRKPPVRPGDSPRATPPEPVPLDVFTRRLGVMEEDQAGIVVQLEQMDGSLENVTQRVGDLVLRMDGMGAVLEDIRARLGSLPAPVVPAAPGNLRHPRPPEAPFRRDPTHSLRIPLCGRSPSTPVWRCPATRAWQDEATGFFQRFHHFHARLVCLHFNPHNVCTRTWPWSRLLAFSNCSSHSSRL